MQPALQDLQQLFCEDSDAKVSGGRAAATSSAEPPLSLSRDSAVTGQQAQGSTTPRLPKESSLKDPRAQGSTMSSQPQDSALTGPQAQGSTRHVANTVLANTVLARYPHFVMFAVDEELSKSIKAKVIGCCPRLAYQGMCAAP